MIPRYYKAKKYSTILYAILYYCTVFIYIKFIIQTKIRFCNEKWFGSFEWSCKSHYRQCSGFRNVYPTEELAHVKQLRLCFVHHSSVSHLASLFISLFCVYAGLQGKGWKNELVFRQENAACEHVSGWEVCHMAQGPVCCCLDWQSLKREAQLLSPAEGRLTWQLELLRHGGLEKPPFTRAMKADRGEHKASMRHFTVDEYQGSCIRRLLGAICVFASVLWCHISFCNVKRNK